MSEIVRANEDANINADENICKVVILADVVHSAHDCAGKNLRSPMAAKIAALQSLWLPVNAC